MKDVRANANADRPEKQDKCKGPKPFVERVTLRNGKVKLHGVSDAARWMGVTPAALSALSRGVNAIPITWEARARAEFPELFERRTQISGQAPDAP